MVKTAGVVMALASLWVSSSRVAAKDGSGGARAAGTVGVGGATGVAGPPKPSTWSVLVQPKQRWVLHDDSSETPRRVIIVETYDVHQVAGATVARLRWTVKDSERAKDSSQMGSETGPCFTRLAVNERGLYILRDQQDDAAIATQVAGKPSRSDPPRAYEGTKKNQGRYLNVYPQADGPVICMGNGPTPGDGECDDVCFEEMCVTPTRGVVQVSGTAAPDYGVFQQKGFKLAL
jgi:hypothetical protein